MVEEKEEKGEPKTSAEQELSVPETPAKEPEKATEKEPEKDIKEEQEKTIKKETEQEVKKEPEKATEEETEKAGLSEEDTPKKEPPAEPETLEDFIDQMKQESS